MHQNQAFQPLQLKNFTLKNRIVMPPMVCPNWAEEDGIVSEKHVEHYHQRAQGQVGLIIVEATAVHPEGRIYHSQLGIWSDQHIDGLSKIARVCHDEGVPVIIQIHHAGLVTAKSIIDIAMGPSPDPESDRTREMSIAEIHEVKNWFVQAAIRASKAGFDGIELHGAHGYLLHQFASSTTNHRADEYGINQKGRLKLAIEIIEEIRKNTKPEFIISYRMGVNAPDLEDGIIIAQLLQHTGIDLIHASHGGAKEKDLVVPEGFDYNWIVWGGCQIKQNSTLPVVVVNEIKTPERANYLITNNLADLIAIGRDLLTDPNWVVKANNNEPIHYCINCKPRCKKFRNTSLCPINPY